MGNYEPLSPQVLGHEWSPIRQESVPLDPGTEIGYTFTIDEFNGTNNNDVATIQWLLSHMPTTPVTGQVPFASIYRRGDEVNVGAINRITIGVSSVSVTGAAVSSGSATTALTNASDDLYITLGTGNSSILSFFNMNIDVQNAVQNRRVLRANLLYTASGPFAELDNVTSGIEATLQSNTDTWSFGLGSITGPLNPNETNQILRVNLGEVNPFWNSGASPYAQSAKYPWRWEELNFMNSSTPIATRFGIAIRGRNIPSTTQPFRVSFVALELILCDENRLFYGGTASGDTLTAPATAFDSYIAGVNVINMRTTSFQTTGSLSPGDYTITMTLADAGDIYNRGDKPRISALRQVEELPVPAPHGILITRWQDPGGDIEDLGTGLLYPQYYFAGEAPSLSRYDILPGIDIMRGVGTPVNITAPHTYAIQVPASVYTNTYAEQIIINDAQGTSVSYPWVRFYARRFGDVSRTLRIRSVTSNTYNYSATIDQKTFDALPEIIDGWREVTLRFDAPTPSFQNNGSNTQWRWDTINGNVSVQDRWEILAGYTDSLSGTPSYGQTIAFATFNNIARPPTVELSNANTDATLMFAQDMPAVTGFGVTTAVQPITGVGIECYSPLECIPTGIYYNELTWSPGNFICDTFSRAITGFGASDTNQLYAVTGTGSAYVDGTHGIFTFVTSGNECATIPSVQLSSPEAYVELSFTGTPTSGTASTYIGGIILNSINSSAEYRMLLVVNANRTITIRVDVVSGGVTTLESFTLPNILYVPNQVYKIRVRNDQGSLRMRVWEDGTPEPGVWHINTTDSTYTIGIVGLYASVTGSGEFPALVAYDNFIASEMLHASSTYELQRYDDIDTEWRTIMVSSGQCPITFNDYEARTGVTSYYRIRRVNALRFPGPWSSIISNTLPSAGVAGIGDGNSVLIFTSNEVQDGSRNLAYVMIWDNNVTEDFTFPESNTVELQPVYGRDYVIAFRPTERGGERFSRALLVNNALVSHDRLRAGFRSLRDLAWDDLSYVCVRNELSDRWLSTIIVPSGSIQGGRRKFIARVDVIEVTDSPTQVLLDSITLGGG